MSAKKILIALGAFASLGILAVLALAFVVGRDSAAANDRTMAACGEASPGMSADEFVILAETHGILTVRDGRPSADSGADYVIELMDGSFRMAVICVGEFSSRGQLISAEVERID